MSFKLLLLEDDELFAQTLEDFLSEEGLAVRRVGSIEQMLDLIQQDSFDLYLLDIKLPDGNALELLEELRTLQDRTPTIFLTSMRDSGTLKNGLKIGADDFLKKPVDLEELLLRIKAVLRRCYSEEVVQIDTITFDITNMELKKEGKSIECNPKELQLLALFIKNRKKVLPKEEIIAHLWSEDELPSVGALRVYINRLKKIFGKEAISNIRGVGYRFEK